MSSTRLFGVAVVGIAIICASAYGVSIAVSERVRRADNERVSLQLRAAQAEVERGRIAELKLRVGLLAADGASMAYIADALAVGATPGQSVDAASISDLLAERREQLGLDAVGVIDVEGRFVAGTRPWTDSGGVPARHPLFTEARSGQRLAIGLVREDGRLFLGAIQPMTRAGTVDAYLYAASALDTGLLKTLTALAPMDLALVAAAPPTQLLGQSGDLPESSFTAALERAGATRIDDALEVTAAGDRTTLIPLFGHGEQALLLARTRSAPEDHLAVTAPMLALAGLLSTLWTLVLGVWWRSTLQPFHAACDLLERAATGDFHLRAPAWRGGVRGRFAAAFDALMLRAGSR